MGAEMHELQMRIDAAARRVARAKMIIVRQRKRIAHLKSAWRDSQDAEHTLNLFVATLAALEWHEGHLRKERSRVLRAKLINLHTVIG
jgi:hypothetical protein